MFVKLKKMLSILLILPYLICVSCTAPKNRSVSTSNSLLHAVVTFDALYELASAVGGDKTVISKIIPDGMEAHDFEPKAKDLSVLAAASVFLTNGLGFEPWAARAVDVVNNDALITAEVSEGIEPIALEGGGVDMHIWLSLKCASVMADNICGVFSEADPENAQYYLQNCEAFKEEVLKLYDKYYEKFQNTAQKTIVTQHSVFAYLCRDYNLSQNSIEGVFVEGETSAKALAELVEFCRANEIEAIFAEELGVPIVSEVLAKEAGVSIVTVYTIEGYENGLSYLERMEMNLEAIYSALA